MAFQIAAAALAIAMQMHENRYTWVVVTLPNTMPVSRFTTTGDISCAPHRDTVITPEAIAVDDGGTTVDTSTIAFGKYIP